MSDEQLKRAFRALVAPNTDTDDWKKFASAMTKQAQERTDLYVEAIKERDAALAENARLREAVDTYRAESLVMRQALNEILNAAEHDGNSALLLDTVREQSDAVVSWLRARALVEPQR